MKNSILLISLLALSLSSNAQSGQDLDPGFKIWSDVGLDWRMNQKFSLKLSETFGFNTAVGQNLQFLRTDLELLYRPVSLIQIGAGYKPGFYSRKSGYKLYNRVYLDAILRHNLFKMPTKHTLTAEMFIPQTPKYKYRFSYMLNYYFKNDFLPMQMTPYIEGQVYYYLGGKPNSYYDNSGVKVAKQAPNDFHRFRVGGGITAKPLPFLRASIYYMYQKEFNTGLTKNREINIPNSSHTKTYDQFNNFSVLGVKLEFIILSKEKVKTNERINTDLDEN